jgi:hypothetical protein
VHVSLAELRAMDDGSVLETEWVTEMRIRWCARRAETADSSGGDGGAWLDGDAARAMSCDATIVPVVTGDVDPGALDDLVRLCLQLAGHGAHCTPQPAPDPAVPDPATPPTGDEQLSSMSREAVRQTIIGKAINFLLHSRVPLDLRTFHSTDRFVPVVIVWEKD